MAAVVRSLLQRAESPPMASEPWPEERPLRDDDRRADDRLVRRLRRASEVVHDLRQRNDRLARALGACATCWGEDPGCGDCGGSGRPGYEAVDPDLFKELILPAIDTQAPTSGDPEAGGSPERSSSDADL
jgi:hypothetical protein